MSSSFVDCTACKRKHKRPVNTRCEYAKLAVKKCSELGLSTSGYMLYLPDLWPEDTESPAAGVAGKSIPLSPIVQQVGAEASIETNLIHQLISESVQSRKLLESSQSQVERMMAQLLDMKIATKSAPTEGGQGAEAGGAGTAGAVQPQLQPQPSTSTPVLPSVPTTSVPVSQPVGGPWTSIPPGFTHYQPWPGQTAHLVSSPTVSTNVPTTPWTLPGLAAAAGIPAASGASAAMPATAAGTTQAAAAALQNPYMPPYLLPGASQQASVHIPYRCEVDHHHPPRHSCSTAKRKLTLFDLDVHMRYASSASITVDDVIAGSLSLLESMMRQGVDGSGYIRHIRFLVEKSKLYIPSALIGYDTEMRERAEFFGPGVFTYGDHDLTHRWLGVESLKPSASSLSGNLPQTGKGDKKKTSKFSRFGSCWNWNEGKACKGSPCKYKHVCSGCQGDHKLQDCPSKTNTSLSSVKSK